MWLWVQRLAGNHAQPDDSASDAHTRTVRQGSGKELTFCYGRSLLQQRLIQQTKSYPSMRQFPFVPSTIGIKTAYLSSRLASPLASALIRINETKQIDGSQPKMAF